MTSDNVNPDVRSVDVLLDRLDALPTPTAVALRLMTVLESDVTTTREVVDLISTDPALSAKVVGLCSRCPRGRALGITSVERAVVLLGFDAVRAAALSVRLFEVAERFSARDEKDDNFDSGLYWRHSLAVAVLSERITQYVEDVSGSSAFIAGLLHDIGHLALHAVAPQVFDSACEIADTQCSSVDLVSQRRIGIDGRIAGRRIGSRWGLPQELIDTIWLLDQPANVICGCMSANLIRVVSLADAIVSRDHVSIRGHGIRASSIHELARDLGLDLQVVLDLRAEVLEEVEMRAEELGLDGEPIAELLLQSISRANSTVSRFALAYRERSEDADLCASSLESLTGFLDRFPCGDLSGTVEAVGASARGLVPETSTCVVLLQVPLEPDPRIHLCSSEGVRRCDVGAGVPMDVVRDVLSREQLERSGAVIRLNLRGNSVAVIALGYEGEQPSAEFDPDLALQAAWTAALDAALAREQSEHLAERLALANRELASHRESAARARAASAVGAIAAGAAHEINTPLAVIAGRAHLLAECLNTTELGRSAADVKEAALKVAEIVEALADSVAPIEIRVAKTDVGELLSEACRDLDSRVAGRVSIRTNGPFPVMMLDGFHIRRALVEVLENALRASGDGEVVLEAFESSEELVLKITDHGPGFSDQGLEHAFDAFFSEQPAGRRQGLGLSTARRLVEAHGGSISIRNRRKGGSGGVVCITFSTEPQVGVTDGLQEHRSERLA